MAKTTNVNRSKKLSGEASSIQETSTSQSGKLELFEFPAEPVLIEEPEETVEESTPKLSLEDFKKAGNDYLRENKDARIIALKTTNPELVDMAIDFSSSNPVFVLDAFDLIVTKTQSIEIFPKQ